MQQHLFIRYFLALPTQALSQVHNPRWVYYWITQLQVNLIYKLFHVKVNVLNETVKTKFFSQSPYTRKRFTVFLYCLLFSRESRTTSSLLETIQKRRKTFPCVRGLIYMNELNCKLFPLKSLYEIKLRNQSLLINKAK